MDLHRPELEKTLLSEDPYCSRYDARHALGAHSRPTAPIWKSLKR
jgi:hypothetical protein